MEELKPSELAKIEEDKRIEKEKEPHKIEKALNVSLDGTKYLYYGIQYFSKVAMKVYTSVLALFFLSIVAKSSFGLKEYYSVAMDALVVATLIIAFITLGIYVLLALFTKFSMDKLHLLDIEMWLLTKHYHKWYDACWSALGKLAILLALMSVLMKIA